MTQSHRFADIGFDDFRRMAGEEGLSMYERIGFPDAYRLGHEAAIFKDIRCKLSNLDRRGIRVIDIGPGCTDLPRALIEHCHDNDSELTLIDSQEMLALLPERERVHKVAARFPDCIEHLQPLEGRVDAILCYSVLHYIFRDAAFFSFLDVSLSLLSPGGQFLIGDIPNITKRKRFFSSEAGIRYHQQFMNTTDRPEVRFNQIEHDQIDDAVVIALLQRARGSGFDAYVMPQASGLPMSNRREDILICRP